MQCSNKMYIVELKYACFKLLGEHKNSYIIVHKHLYRFVDLCSMLTCLGQSSNKLLWVHKNTHIHTQRQKKEGDCPMIGHQYLENYLITMLFFCLFLNIIWILILTITVAVKKHEITEFSIYMDTQMINNQDKRVTATRMKYFIVHILKPTFTI